MRSFSILTVLSALAASVAAYTTPTEGPVGNPIGSPLEGEIVPVGKPYTIVWKPDTPNVGTVTLVLLRGPGSNVQPMYPIIEKAPNSGSFVWTPATDLESDTTHYALQLIEDASGRFQWGMQFGIDNPAIPKGGAGGDDEETTSTTTATGDDDYEDEKTTTVTATSTSTAVVTVTGTKPEVTETETMTGVETTSTKASNLTMTLVTSTTKAAETTMLESTTMASNATVTSTQPAIPTKSGDEEGAAARTGASIAIIAVAAAAFALF